MPKTVLGIELGAQHLAVVQLTGTAKAFDITTAVHHLLPAQEDPAVHLQHQQEALEHILDSHRIHADTVIVSLPAAQAVLRNITLPFKDARRIRQVLNYTLDEHMPYDPDEVVADFQNLPDAPSDQAPVLAAAVPEDRIAELLDMLNEIGLDPNMIDLDGFGLANAAVLGMPPLPTNTLLVDVSPARTLLTLMHHGAPVFARSWGLGWTEGATALDTYVSRLAKQIQHTIYAYENALQHPFDTEQVILSGLAATPLTELADQLQRTIGVNVHSYRLTTDSYRGQTAPPTSVDQANTAVALGTALKGLYRQATGLNLRRGRFSLHRDLQELRGRLVVVGCLLVLLAGMGIGSLYLNNRLKTQRLKDLQANIERVFRATIPDGRMIQPVFQMQEQVTTIADRLRAFGGVSGAQLSGLQTLREISTRAPSELTLNIDNLTITSKSVDLGGVTGSYDDVVKLKAAIEASPFFSSVKINSAKNESNKVAFKLTITIAQSLDNLS